MNSSAPLTAFCCRACNSPDTPLLLDMGRLPLANAFTTGPDDHSDDFREYLRLVMCSNCKLVQIRDEVDRDKLFSSYLWVIGTSETTRRYAKWFSSRLAERYLLKAGAKLVEVASNDGFFLEHYREVGFDVLGVDPSNLALEANERGVPSIRAFFGQDVARRILSERGAAEVIVARNVLGHASELQDLAAGLKLLLAPGGVCVIESPYAYFLRNELQYDTIFHEHPSYLTAGSVSNLMARFGLKLTDATFVQMNGGSFVFEVRHADYPSATDVQSIIDFENLIGLNSLAGWNEFARSVEAQREHFVRLLTDLKHQEKRVVGYGAAAKCMTMLNYCNISTDLLSLMGDANPRKQGLFCPGVRIPVVSPEALIESRPDYIMIGAWNFKDEIMHSFREIHGYRGGFILPLPMPTLVEALP